MEATTAQVMEEALAWGAAHVGTGGSDNTQSSVLEGAEAEAARLVSLYARERIDDALWRLRHATDLTDGRVKAQAIALLEAAVTEASGEGIARPS